MQLCGEYYLFILREVSAADKVISYEYIVFSDHNPDLHSDDRYTE